MPCYQTSNLPSGFTTAGRPSYKTEAECNQACQEGACCEGTTCTVKPQCQCQGTGKVFKGVGTTCSPNPCKVCPATLTPQTQYAAGASWCKCFCGEGDAQYPRFINVRVVGEYAQVNLPSPYGAGGVWRSRSFNSTMTLTGGDAGSYWYGPACVWRTGGVAGPLRFPLGSEGAEADVSVWATPHPSLSNTAQVRFEMGVVHQDGVFFSSVSGWQGWTTFSSPQNWRPPGQDVTVQKTLSSPNSSFHPLAISGPVASGACFSSAVGYSLVSWNDSSVSFVSIDLDECRGVQPNLRGGSAYLRVSLTFEGFQV
jgi:hypothetical protein